MPKVRVSSRHFRRLVKEETRQFLHATGAGAVKRDDTNYLESSQPTNSYLTEKVNYDQSASDCNINKSLLNGNETLKFDENSISDYSEVNSSDRGSDNSVHVHNDGPNANLLSSLLSNNDEGPTNLTVSDRFKTWAVTHQISHNALRDYLQNVAPYIANFNDCPRDPRTFLGTPGIIKKRSVHPGFYCHIGIQTALEQKYASLNIKPDGRIINIGINIDGLPLSKSSSSQVYPILCINKSINESANNISLVGIYHGYQKPDCFNEFLIDFVAEAKKLTKEGIVILGRKFEFKITMYLFDAVAKSSILGCKGHSGYNSCTKCKQAGFYSHERVCFPDVQFQLRDNNSFLNAGEDGFLLKKSILSEIPDTDFISDVPLDYMHLICLGVVKKLVVQTWAFGSIPHKFCSKDFNTVSSGLESLIPFIPSEFARRPRILKESKRWKATEFRQFLLYTGPVVLKSVLSKTKYAHFLTLHVAIVILVSRKYHYLHLDYAKKLLIHFVEATKIIYGKHYLTHNFHNLLHLAEDARKHGTLDNFSNFSSENYLQYIKKLVRKPTDVLEQIVKRTAEIDRYFIANVPKGDDAPFKLCSPHNKGPLINKCSGPQYKAVQFRDYQISTNHRDSCCQLEDGTVVIVKNFAYCSSSNTFGLVGNHFEVKDDFYKEPCASSVIAMEQLWKVVKFYNQKKNEEFIEVVPKSWIDGQECYWPPFDSRKDIEGAIKHCLTPDANKWRKYTDFEVSKKNYNKFKNASAKANRALKYSDLDESEHEKLKEKRTVKQVVHEDEIYNYSSPTSDDDEPSFNDKLPFPSPPNKQAQKIKPRAVKYSVSATTGAIKKAVSTCQTSRGGAPNVVSTKTKPGASDVVNLQTQKNAPNVNIRTGKEASNIVNSRKNARSDVNTKTGKEDEQGMFADDDGHASEQEQAIEENLEPEHRSSETQDLHFMLMNIPDETLTANFLEEPMNIAENGNNSGNTELLKKLVKLSLNNNRLLKELSATSKEVLNKVKLGGVQAVNNEDDRFEDDYRGAFPIKDDARLAEINHLLRDNPALFGFAVKKLALEAGNDVNESVRRAMTIIIDDEVALLYSLKGHKAKKSFQVYDLLVKLIIESVRKIFPKVSNGELEVQMSIWLTKARRRINEKEKKMQNAAD